VNALSWAIAIDPWDAELYSMRAILWTRLKYPERAWRDYEAIQAIVPGDPTALMNCGIDLIGCDDTIDEGLALMEYALAMAPNDPLIHSNIGVGHWRRGDYRQALLSYDAALALRPNYARAHSNRAHALTLLGRHQEALEAAETALSLSPKMAKAYVHRGLARAGLGDVDAAVEDYRTAIRIGGEVGAADDAIAALKDLGLAA